MIGYCQDASINGVTIGAYQLWSSRQWSNPGQKEISSKVNGQNDPLRAHSVPQVASIIETRSQCEQIQWLQPDLRIAFRSALQSRISYKLALGPLEARSPSLATLFGALFRLATLSLVNAKAPQLDHCRALWLHRESHRIYPMRCSCAAPLHAWVTHFSIADWYLRRISQS